MLAALLSLLFLVDGVSSERDCSYQDVLNHLNLTKTNELYHMTRPVKNYKRPTEVSLEVLLYAILDVVEKDQKFIPYVWTVMRWHNEYISWDPYDFCGIDNVSLPTEILWTPDITIEEMTEKDKAPPSPYLTISAKGDVEAQNDQVLVSTCRMHIYQFPFDIQSCSLSFKSVIYAARDVRLRPSDNSSEATEWSREVMRTQYEWLFINMTVTTKNASDILDYDTIIYTVCITAGVHVEGRLITVIMLQASLALPLTRLTLERHFQINMKRRSVLYIVNFLLPVLFFLCLDLASFLISEGSGEKLSFKVTVLLAVTVLQLILNEILPSSSNSIPLISVYCIGIFALMMVSLLETIFVMHLMQKDTVSHDKRDGDQILETHARTGCIYDASAGEASGPQLMVKEVSPPMSSRDARDNTGNSSRAIERHSLEKLSDELRQMERTLMQLINSGKDKTGYWTRVAAKVNKIFFIVYVMLMALKNPVSSAAGKHLMNPQKPAPSLYAEINLNCTGLKAL
ncbi:LOW QUALITY PROTEIN: 5-hydroxytryptamine receptor 3A-like [Aulostomus maculatus]